MSKDRKIKGIGATIWKIRKASGASQEQLGRAVGISEGHVGRIERGEVDPGYNLVKKIAETLGCEIRILLKEE